MFPSLSTEGWISDGKKILDRLLSCYLTTDTRQTYLFQNNLTSLAKTYYLYINQPEEMSSAIKTDLQKMLGYYFKIVDVRTVLKQSSVNNDYYILISANVTDSDGRTYELARITQINTSRLRKIIPINNVGVGLEYLANI